MAYSTQSIIALAVALPLLADIAIVLRFYVRIKLRPSYIGIDDCLAVFSGLLTSTIGALTIVGVVLGTQGRVYAEIPPERYIIQARVDFATLIIEKFLYGGMKLCMVFFFRRIFNAHRGFRIFSECIIGFLIVWTFAYVFAYLGSCTPLGIWFTPGAPRTPPHCVDVNLLNFTYAVTDPISDILVVVMPFPLIRRLHISHRERVGLFAIFLLGTLSTIASLLRLGFIAEAYAAQFGAGGNNHGSGVAPAVWSMIEGSIGNNHGSGVAPAVWSMIEGSIGVLAANLPPLGPLLRSGHVPHHLSALSSSIKDALSRTRTTRKGSTATAPDMAQQGHFGGEVHAVLGEANAAHAAAPATPATTSTADNHHFPRNKSSFQSFV